MMRRSEQNQEIDVDVTVGLKQENDVLIEEKNKKKEEEVNEEDATT